MNFILCSKRFETNIDVVCAVVVRHETIQTISLKERHTINVFKRTY